MSDRSKIFIFLFIASIVFCWGFLGDFALGGIGDWDQHLFYHGSPRKIIADFWQFPLWNPYYCGGNPLLANPQSPFLSPFFLFVLVFGEVVGLKLSIIAHAFVGLVGMYMLSKEFKIKGPAVFFAGFVFIFSGVFALHMAEGHTTWLPMVYIPFVLLYFRRALNKPINLLLSSAFMALMLFEGGALMVVYTGLFLAIYAFLESLSAKNIKPFAVFVAICICFVLFSSIKLVPMLDFTMDFPRNINDTRSMTFGIALYALIGFDQSYDLILLGMRQGWWEYSAFVGPIALLLYLYSFRRFSSELSLKITGIIFFLIALGSGDYINLWGWLQKLPVFSQQRVPFRFLIIFIFTVSLLAAMALSRFYEKRKEKGKGHGVTVMIVALAFLNMMLVTSPVLRNVFKFQLPEDEVSAKFTQHRLKEEIHSYGPRSAMYPALLRNDGVKNCYETQKLGMFAIAAEEPGYRGEAFLLGGAHSGEVELSRWSPNKLEYRVVTKRENLLIVNQNFHKGWRSGHEVVSYKGLLAVEVAAGDKDVKLYYCPDSFRWGLLVSALSLAGAFTWVFYRRRRGRL